MKEEREKKVFLKEERFTKREEGRRGEKWKNRNLRIKERKKGRKERREEQRGRKKEEKRRTVVEDSNGAG